MQHAKGNARTVEARSGTSSVAPGTDFSSKRLERVFATCFEASCNTQLVGGAEEPLYTPATLKQPALLCYREDFFASALHEIAHWCIAGHDRLQLADFGYWYAPQGRDPSAQRAFEAVEAKPQALEWLFSRACGFAFQVSADNLDPTTGQLADSRMFCQQVLAEAHAWQRRGLPDRGKQFYAALAHEFGTTLAVSEQRFSLADLR